ncbi:MAG TPA: iron-sulfur cluster assembly scaffold protein [Terriglobales bacterium]|jgi:nitrogen fixation NifU-like protein
MYSAQLLDHFQNPRNAGEVAEPDACAQLENPVCGDVLKLTMKTADGRIEEIRFKAKGCVAAMACASALTELVRGLTTVEAENLNREEITRRVGGLPEASMHASQLALDTLAALLKHRK